MSDGYREEGEQQVAAALVPKSFQPRSNRQSLIFTHWYPSCRWGKNIKTPGTRAGRIDSLLKRSNYTTVVQRPGPVYGSPAVIDGVIGAVVIFQ